MAKDKARYFTFLLYPESIPADWKQRLELIGVPIAISPLHDKDKSSAKGQIYKKAHYHVVYVTKNPVTSDSVRKRTQRVLFQTLWSSFVDLFQCFGSCSNYNQS